MKDLMRILKLAVGFVLLAALVVYFDVASITATLVQANAIYLAGIFALLIVSLLIKGYRWHNLVKMLRKGAKYWDAVVSFAGGFLVSYFSPGRMMEPVRGLVYKKLAKTPFASSAPLVLVERIGDVLFLLVVSFIGLYLTAQLTGPFFGSVVVSGLVLLCLLSVIVSKKIGKFFMDIALKIPMLSERKEVVKNIYDNFYAGMHDLKKGGWMPLALITGIGWVVEAFILVFSLKAFGVNLAFPKALFAVALATVVGLLSTIPAGLGVMDASLLFILSTFGIEEAVAVSGVLVYRFTGIAFLLICAVVVFLKFGAIPSFSKK